LKLSESVGSKLHHRDVVRVALRRLEEDLSNDGNTRNRILDEVQREMHKD
jgi:hypothetical protein